MSTPPPSLISKRMYGIWQPGQGWVKAFRKDGHMDAYATDDIKVAKDVARRIGNGARVEYIDDALAMMEADLIKAEARVKWWQVWRWKGVSI